MSQPKKVALLCPALEDPKNNSKASEALKRRELADYRCYQALSELGQFIGFEKNGVLGKALMEQFDEEEVADILERCEDAVRNRDEANNDFLGAVVGRS